MSSSNPATSSPPAKQIIPIDTVDERKTTGNKCQTVLEHLYDSHNGYKACAKDSTDPVLQTFSQKVAKIRSDFISQLSTVIRNELNLEPVTSSSGLGTAHQTWIDVKAWSTDGRGKAVALAQIHRGEAQLINQYQMALSEAELLNEKIRHVLQEQLKTIRDQDAAICVMDSSNPSTSTPPGKPVTAIDQRKMIGNKCQILLEHLYDSYNGYKSCAEDCTDPALQELSQKVAKIRSDFIGQLSSVIRSELGLEPVTSSSGLGRAHQMWIDAKAWFTDGRDKASVVVEVHRAETHLIHQYEVVLSEAELLNDKMRHVLQEQLKTIREQDAAMCVMGSSNPIASTPPGMPVTAIDQRKMIVNKCQTLLEHLYDSYNGYKSCAEDCTDPVLRELSQKIAKIRSDFIGQLSSVIRSELGLEPVRSSSGLGTAHQMWIDAKACFTNGREKASVVAEVHRAETRLIHQYEMVLSEAELLDDKIRHVLQEQLKTIREQDAAICLL